MKMVDAWSCEFWPSCGYGQFFSSIGLFMELLSLGIYAIGTVRPNRVALPMDLKDTKNFKNSEQDFMIWRMHNNWQVCCVMWKDKKPVLLISTHALPIQAPCEFLVITVPRWNDAVQNGIPTSSVLLSIPRICEEWMWRTNFVPLTHAKYGVTNGDTMYFFSSYISL